MDIQQLAEQYRNELTQKVLPFWQKHAFDPLYPGVFAMVAQEGTVISTDKPVALQAQVVWAFALGASRFGPQADWHKLATGTADFLLSQGRDAKGTWHHRLDRRGTPLASAEGIDTDLYCLLALGQLAAISQEEALAALAGKSLAKLLRKRDAVLNKQKTLNQKVPLRRTFKSLEEFALIGHALLASEKFVEAKWYQKALLAYTEELTQDFYDKRSDILLENVTPEGHFWDCPEGRLLVPGRVFEVAGLAMDLADRTRNRKLLNQMLDLIELTGRVAWDEPNGDASPGEASRGKASPGGFFYHMDIKSLTPVEPRWGHKLAWVHLEALQTFLKAHLLSARPVFLELFEKTHAYVWQNFPDATDGEWFGELTRDGLPFVSHKITPEKGCFALVRNLANITRLLEMMYKTDEPALIRSPRKTRKANPES